MTTSYTATVTVADDLADPDDVLDALVGHSAVHAQHEPERADVTLSVDAGSLHEATGLVVGLVEQATGSLALRVEVATSEEFDRANGVELSVP